VEWIGGEVRPADSCSGEAPVARACWREKWCGGIGVVTALLYEVEGRRDGAEAVDGGHTGGRHYHSVGGSVGARFREKKRRGRFGAGRLSAPRTGGKGRRRGEADRRRPERLGQPWGRRESAGG
jgi:hypothetical protein